MCARRKGHHLKLGPGDHVGHVQDQAVLSGGARSCNKGNILVMSRFLLYQVPASWVLTQQLQAREVRTLEHLRDGSTEVSRTLVGWLLMTDTLIHLLGNSQGQPPRRTTGLVTFIKGRTCGAGDKALGAGLL